jgi:hypothetical protein
MAKLMCAKCGGKVKMANGGITPKKVLAKAPVNMYGIPQENMGTSSQYGFGRKGGSTKNLPKAQLGKIVKGVSKFFGPAIGATGKSSKVIKPAAKAVKSVTRADGTIVRVPGIKENAKFMAKNIGGGGLIGTGIAAGLTTLAINNKDKANKNKVAVNKNKVKVNANKVKVNANKQ